MAAEFPTHAVVRLRGNDDMCALLKLLVENGYADVAFMSGPPDAMRRKPTTAAAVQTDVVAESPASAAASVYPIFNVPSHVTFPDLLRIQTLAAASLQQQQQAEPTPAVTQPNPTVSVSLPVTTTADNIQVNRIRASTSTLGKMSPDDGSGDTIRCQLCSNPIKTNRYSNMLNHVRRHATLKQFKCVYCEYQHNETAKVRLHMLHNHDDHDSTPVDKWSPQLQEMWDKLMAQCFPRRSLNGHHWRSDQSRSLLSDAAMSPDSSDFGLLQPEDDEPESKVSRVDGAESSVSPLNRQPEATSLSFGQITEDSTGGSDSPFVKMDPDGSSPLMEFLEEAAAIEITQQQLGTSFTADSTVDRRYSPRNGGNPVSLTCQLCSRSIVSHPRQALLSHAKRHCSKKQWKCIQCSYSSSETAHVRNHMASKHEIVDVTPVDMRNSALEDAWHAMFARCFPSASQPPHRLRSRVFDSSED